LKDAAIPSARSAQKAFVKRGLASSTAARKSGKYVPAAAVLGKLARRLDKARRVRKAAESSR